MRKFFFPLFLVLFGVGLIACQSESSSDGDNAESESIDTDTETDSKDESVDISFLTHWAAPQVEELEGYIEEYKAEAPNVNIEVRAVPFGELLTTLSTQASSKDGPTITGIYELWLPQLVADGIAAAAPEVFATDITQHYSDGIVSAASIDEHIYGYPNEVVLYALNYNKALFAEAGIDTPPSNWEELVDYAKKLTKKDGNGR